MTTTRFSSDDSDLDLLYKHLAAHNLQPLWKLHGLLTNVPTSRAVPFVWRADELRQLAERAGELVGIDRGGDRRVLACSNPGLDGAPYAVDTLWAAVQYLQAGESAPAHRHTPAALRFILSGDGVWTNVDGDAVHMSAGDLVLTPSWTFHEHHNSGHSSMMWLDVLDLPIVAGLNAVFYEDGPSEEVDRATPLTSRSEISYGGGPGLLPVWSPERAARNARSMRASSPLIAYRWTDTDRALEAQLGAGAPFGHLRYSDPTSGRDVMPTMRCEFLRVPAHVSTGPMQQTGNRVGAILSGSAHVVIGAIEADVAAGDILAIPSWSALTVIADSTLDLFVTSDAPTLDALGLYRGT